MQKSNQFNLRQLAKELGVHHKTVGNWWKKGKLKGAFKSEISGEILIPSSTVDFIKRNYRLRIK